MQCILRASKRFKLISFHQVATKWDGSHWQSVHFTADDTGRIVREDASALEMIKVEMSPPSTCEGAALKHGKKALFYTGSHHLRGILLETRTCHVYYFSDFFCALVTWSVLL